MVRNSKGRFTKESTLKKLATGTANMKAVNEKKKLAKVMKKNAAELRGHLMPAGRRVMSLAKIAEDMWCQKCNVPLSLRFMEEEDMSGLASVFKVRCHSCLSVVQVTSDRAVQDHSKPGPDLFAANLKCALGCIDTGIGHEQINNWLSCMNIPIVHHNTMKRAEEKIGPYVTAVAKESCRAALQKERRQTLTNPSPGTPIVAACDSTEESVDDPAPLPETPSSRSCTGCDESDATEEVRITAKYDFGWQKRGHGRCYDSHSGHGCAIGWHTNKVIAFKALSKYCAMCARGHDPSDHQCVKNYSGSSKGMEPVAAVDMLVKNNDFKEAGCVLGTLVGDADSSTMAAILRECSHPVNKILDINHSVKGLSRALYKHKAKGFSFLTTAIISNLKRCLSYALAQNVNNVEGTRAAISNIPRHVYGDHSGCGEWCKAKDNPDYMYRDFPGNVALSNVKFRPVLEEELQSFSNLAEQLAPGGSTQQCESVNHMVATRNPKTRHYCGTNAHEFRVGAAIATKNIGSEYIEDAFRKAELSPSVTKHREIQQRRRLNKAEYQKRLDVKKRRSFLKNHENRAEQTRSRSEGLSYVSGMGTAMERAVAATQSAIDMATWLPSESSLLPECSVVLLDTETTGFKATDQLVQVAAKCRNRSFSVAMMPTVAFNSVASQVSGFSVQNNTLRYRGQVVDTTSSAQAASDFLQFLRSCGSQVVVAGHNLVRFDAPRIVRWLAGHTLAKELDGLVYGFACTVPLLKQGKVRKQEELAKKYLTTPYWKEQIAHAHNAENDCLILEGLLAHFKIDDQKVCESAVTLRGFFTNMSKNQTSKDNVKNLKELNGLISTAMIKKMAVAGVTIEALLKEYRLHGRPGIDVCLAVRIDGRPRVTNRKKIIDKVEELLQTKV